MDSTATNSHATVDVICASHSTSSAPPSFGNGVWIAPTYLLTAAHNLYVDGDVDKPRYQQFGLYVKGEGKCFPIEFVGEDVSRDLALLKCPQCNESYVVLANSYRVGAQCQMVLYDINTEQIAPILTPIQRDGIVTNVLAELPSTEFPTVEPSQVTYSMFASIPSRPGFSGGPLLIDGKLVGILRGQLATYLDRPADPITNPPSDISYWTELTDIRRFLTEQHIL